MTGRQGMFLPDEKGKACMKRIMLWVFIAAMWLIGIPVFSAEAAGTGFGAGHHTGGVVGLPRTEKGGLVQRGIVVDGPIQTQTAVPCTWILSGDTEGKAFVYSVAVDDNSHWDGLLDTQYVSEVTTETSFTYTFYQAEDWKLFVYAVDLNDAPEDPGQLMKDRNPVVTLWFEVTDGGENQVTRAVRQAANACRADNDFETVENIHDWLMDHCVYDDAMRHYTASSLFLDGIGVCNSYARAFCMICEELNIPCRRVVGLIGENNRHAWNAARVGGKWALYDATWDDDGYNAFTRHVYCGLTDADMNMTRIPMLYIGGDTVVCDDLSCHYYLHSGRWRSLALPLLAAVQENIDLNLADFRLDGGQYNPPYEASTYPDDPYYWGRILECGLNQGGVWTRSNGRTYNAQFSYDSSQNYEPWIRCCLESHGTLVLPEGTREVRAEALEGTAANRAVLPASCESIESGAFAGMDLWSIEIPAQSTDIDPNAFGNVPNLTVITVPGSDAARFAEEKGYTLEYLSSQILQPDLN